MNTFGTHFRLTTFGESHGPAVGGIVDGLPSGLRFDAAEMQKAMLRRSPLLSAGATARREPDEVEILSGIYNGMTLGTPVGFIIRNRDVRSEDYAALADVYRPNHADYTYNAKYGIRDPRGGGRASARETACRVAGGVFADLILRHAGISVVAWTAAIGDIEYHGTPEPDDVETVFASSVRCPDKVAAGLMLERIERARSQCDSVGGVVGCAAYGVPAGLGEPLANKLQALLAQALMSIPAVRGFEYGDGFAAAAAAGSGQADFFYTDGNGAVRTTSNHSGGIQGGISNGMPVLFRVAFKPLATMPGRTVPTVRTDGTPTEFTATGRHDVCAVPRAVAVVQAVARMVLADAVLAAKVGRLSAIRR